MEGGFTNLTNMYYIILLITGFVLGIAVGSAKKIRRKKENEQSGK